MGGSSCPIPDGALQYNQRGTAYRTMEWTALGCTGFTIVMCISLCVLHLFRYRAPKEQRQIIRICFSPVVYAVIAFFELYKYSAAQYIDPIGDVYEAFGLAALYLLFIQYAAPTNNFHLDTLADVRAAATIDPGYDWVRIGWMMVFQYSIVEIFVTAVIEATQATGTYCTQSLNPKYAHLWTEIASSISIFLCVMAILRFYGKTKPIMKQNRGLAKIIAFKVIVFIRFIQAWVFSGLLDHGYVTPGKTFSYNDILYGIPAVLTCAEMALFSFGFWFAFSASEYATGTHRRQKALPVYKAVFHALNPSDLIMGMVRIFSLYSTLKKEGEFDKMHAAQEQAKKNGGGRKAGGPIGMLISKAKQSSNKKSSTPAPATSGYSQQQQAQGGYASNNVARPGQTYQSGGYQQAPGYEYPMNKYPNAQAGGYNNGYSNYNGMSSLSSTAAEDPRVNNGVSGAATASQSQQQYAQNWQNYYDQQAGWRPSVETGQSGRPPVRGRDMI